ncbi:MAG: class I SAM-dependent methyltransferase [Pseudomonadota bacterium]
MEIYDAIGAGYAGRRRPDPRIGARIDEALGSARTVLNVGAGAGSYESRSRQVTALEPAWTMIAQRPQDAAPVVQGRAEALPFAEGAFDAVMAVLTVHHWTDKALGLAELRRVARDRIVVLTFDPVFRGFWLTDYLPGLIALDEAQMPPLSVFEKAWGGAIAVQPVPIPHDSLDGSLCAYWRRPQAYLDPDVRKAISSFWALGDVSTSLQRLERDLVSGAWRARYGGLLEKAEMDLGYRLVVVG